MRFPCSNQLFKEGRKTKLGILIVKYIGDETGLEQPIDRSQDFIFFNVFSLCFSDVIIFANLYSESLSLLAFQVCC